MIQIDSYFMNRLWYILIKLGERLEPWLRPKINLLQIKQEEDYGNHSLGSIS